MPSRYIEFVDRDKSIDYDRVLSETAVAVGEMIELKSRISKHSPRRLPHLATHFINNRRYVRNQNDKEGSPPEIILRYSTKGILTVSRSFYGINKDKTFMPTVADTNELDNSKYKVVEKGVLFSVVCKLAVMFVFA